jgi:hypothetical protein
LRQYGCGIVPLEIVGTNNYIPHLRAQLSDREPATRRVTRHRSLLLAPSDRSSTRCCCGRFASPHQHMKFAAVVQFTAALASLVSHECAVRTSSSHPALTIDARPTLCLPPNDATLRSSEIWLNKKCSYRTARRAQHQMIHHRFDSSDQPAVAREQLVRS